MKQIMNQEILEFVYETKEERDDHVEDMLIAGWETSGKVKRMKDGVGIMDATQDDCEWFADFWKYY